MVQQLQRSSEIILAKSFILRREEDSIAFLGRKTKSARICTRRLEGLLQHSNSQIPTISYDLGLLQSWRNRISACLRENRRPTWIHQNYSNERASIQTEIFYEWHDDFSGRFSSSTQSEVSRPIQVQGPGRVEVSPLAWKQSRPQPDREFMERCEEKGEWEKAEDQI